MTDKHITDLTSEEISSAISIVDIPNDTKVWFVRAGRAAKYWDDFRLNDYIGVDREDIPDFRSPEGNTVNLKEVQHNYRDQIYRNSIRNLSKEEIAERKHSLTMSAARRAGVLRAFRHEIKIGDLILSPGKGTKELILGIITSDAIISTINHVNLDFEYEKSPFDNIRTVSWLKRVSFFDIPNEVNFIRHGNGAIFEVTENIEKILPLYFSFYQYNGFFNARITVGTREPVTSDDLYDLQGVIVKTKNNPSVSIEQKTKIESPGHVLLTTVLDPTNMQAMLSVLHGLGIGGGIFFVIGVGFKNADKITALLATIRDWSHNKKMNSLEEADKYIDLIQHVDTTDMSDEEKAELKKQQQNVIHRFKISDSPVGEDINDDEL
ncbi:hypothetical protein PWO95_01900 [Weissella paramesenteroides]|uniref:hypothetical protein n=1 Tax=Weissella paramesenteroides TaxID=1249 RepID=UPI0023A9B507|nr:hypothetical protein [Weissella paramesenteroides]WEA53331.1 hypothetical protein PWO95_01900 [Weissella paramesenteroides]